MRKMIILADDLTGAMDTAAFPASCGQPVQVLTELSAELPKDDPVVSVNTDTRRCTSEQAYSVYEKLCKGRFVPDEILFKKIDMGFRGNTPMEIEGCMLGGKFSACFLVPSIPDFGTFTKGGYQYVKGKLLTESLYQADPKHRPVDSYIPRILKNGGCSLPSVVIPAGSGSRLLETVNSALRSGAKILIFDTENNTDCTFIVETLVPRLKNILWAGTLGLIQAISVYMFGPVQEPQLCTKKIRSFCLCGSNYDVTRAQIEQAMKSRRLTLVTANIGDYLDGNPDVYADELVRRCISASRETEHILLAPYVPPEREYKGLDEEILSLLSRCGTEICKQIIPDRLVVIGGDTSGRILDQLGSKRIRINSKPETGLAEGILLDGDLAGKQFAAKGGSVGSIHALEKLLCLPVNTYL
ncbi:MAG: four-carbon acid sugar kinase family protein [Acetivibrionales bacterium]|jgi:uncharacterized protein YgbK (DUF1537 family)